MTQHDIVKNALGVFLNLIKFSPDSTELDIFFPFQSDNHLLAIELVDAAANLIDEIVFGTLIHLFH